MGPPTAPTPGSRPPVHVKRALPVAGRWPASFDPLVSPQALSGMPVGLVGVDIMRDAVQLMAEVIHGIA